jgi:hypothetical protein
MISRRAASIRIFDAMYHVEENGPILQEPARFDDLRQYQDYPDDEPVDINVKEITEFPKHHVVDTDIESLRLMMDILNEYQCGRYAQAFLDYTLKHEQDHADAATAQGMQESVFGVSINQFEPQTGILSWNAFGYHMKPSRPVTKLGWAAIFARPIHFIQADIWGMQALGYEGREDVEHRVAVHNLTYPGNPLPEPLPIPGGALINVEAPKVIIQAA